MKPSPIPVGITPGFVAKQIRKLVDAYGEAKQSPDKQAHEQKLARTLRLVFRTLRLISVDGYRFRCRVDRRFRVLSVERRGRVPHGR